MPREKAEVVFVVNLPEAARDWCESLGIDHVFQAPCEKYIEVRYDTEREANLLKKLWENGWKAGK